MAHSPLHLPVLSRSRSTHAINRIKETPLVKKLEHIAGHYTKIAEAVTPEYRLTGKEPPDFLIELSRTELSIPEGKAMLAMFLRHCRDGHAMARDEFQNAMSGHIVLGPIAAKSVCSLLFDALDVHKRGTISYGEFMYGLSVLLKGTPEQRARVLFSMFDVSGDDMISATEMTTMLHAGLIGGLEEGDVERIVRKAFNTDRRRVEGLTFVRFRKALGSHLKATSAVALSLRRSLVHAHTGMDTSRTAMQGLRAPHVDSAATLPADPDAARAVAAPKRTVPAGAAAQTTGQPRGLSSVFAHVPPKSVGAVRLRAGDDLPFTFRGEDVLRLVCESLSPDKQNRVVAHWLRTSQTATLLQWSFWIVYCRLFQPGDEAVVHYLAEELSSTFVELLRNMGAAKDQALRLLPLGVGEAVYSCFLYGFSLSRELFDSDFRFRVMAETYELFSGMVPSRVLLEAMLQSLFRSEDARRIQRSASTEAAAARRPRRRRRARRSRARVRTSTHPTAAPAELAGDGREESGGMELSLDLVQRTSRLIAAAAAVRSVLHATSLSGRRDEGGRNSDGSGHTRHRGDHAGAPERGAMRGTRHAREAEAEAEQGPVNAPPRREKLKRERFDVFSLSPLLQARFRLRPIPRFNKSHIVLRTVKHDLPKLQLASAAAAAADVAARAASAMAAGDGGGAGIGGDGAVAGQGQGSGADVVTQLPRPDQSVVWVPVSRQQSASEASEED